MEPPRDKGAMEPPRDKGATEPPQDVGAADVSRDEGATDVRCGATPDEAALSCPLKRKPNRDP